MSKIHVMSDNLANKIAAGEVVERISSVVKELVENAIDAKSKTIVVDLENSGTKLIRVTDDGVGMDRDDASLAFQRHATSKLKNEDDLFFINTLGFRGEALPSIASVSKVDLRTGTGSVGTHIIIEGGNFITTENSDGRVGTIFEIKDLFYNTPARLKYLKSDNTELANVTTYIEKLALSHEDISFTLTNNDKRIVFTSGSGDLLKAIHEIYGYSVSSNMIEIKCSNDDYDVYGYICKPSILKSNRNHMTTIVNGRIVRNIEVNKAINDGYYLFKHESKYPVVILKIETDPTLVDVNIHPTKQDIKFSKINDLLDMITKTEITALKKSLLIPTADIIVPTTVYQETQIDRIISDIPDDYLPSMMIGNNINEEIDEIEIQKDQVSMDFANGVSSDDELKNITNNNLKKLELNIIGQVLGTYIVAFNQDGMYLIDQHAAQERVKYEMYMEQLEKQELKTTSMIIPMTIELSSSEAQIIRDHMNNLIDIGFVVEEFGINTFIVKEHPTWLEEGKEQTATKAIFDIIIDGKTEFDRVKFNEHIAKTLACKLSIKANMPITMEESRNLIDQLFETKNPYNCCHGRPSIVTFKKYDIEKLFKRVMN